MTPTATGTGGRAVAADEHGTDPLDGLDQLGPVKDDTAPTDAAPTKRRKRSGTSGAERARRAKAAGGDAGSTAPPRARSTRSRSTKAVNIKAGMGQLYTMVGIGVSMAPHPVAQPVGLAIGQQADACAGAWEQLAKENPRVREALEQLLTVSSVGVLLAAHTPIVLAGVMATQRGQQLAAQAMGAPAPEPAPAPRPEPEPAPPAPEPARTPEPEPGMVAPDPPAPASAVDLAREPRIGPRRDPAPDVTRRMAPPRL